MISDKIARKKRTGWKKTQKIFRTRIRCIRQPRAHIVPRTFSVFLGGNQGNNPGRFRTGTQGHNMCILQLWVCLVCPSGIFNTICCAGCVRLPPLLFLFSAAIGSGCGCGCYCCHQGCRHCCRRCLRWPQAGVHIFKLRIVQHDRLADLVSQWFCDVLTCNTTKWTSAVRTFQTCQLVEHVSLANVQWNPHQSFDSS